MKILFAIQGTGNGHISRAEEIIPYLSQYGQLDLLLSGTQSEVRIPYLIKYKTKGVSYTFGKNGGIDMIDTVKKLRPLQLFKDIRNFPVQDYDLVVNDFEPITAWACHFKKHPIVALSHQAAYLSPKTPRPKKRDHFAELVFRKYAPVKQAIGIHFEEYDSFIRKPVIKQSIRQLEPTNLGHITVYLPAYHHDTLISYFSLIKEFKWQVFSKHTKTAFTQGNVEVQPVNNEAYVKSLASCEGLLTGGGFESPAEALYLGKKLLIIPMFNQYEQLCNALGMKKIGVTVVPTIDNNFLNKLKSWLFYTKPIAVDYPDITAQIVDDAVQMGLGKKAPLIEPAMAPNRPLAKSVGS